MAEAIRNGAGNVMDKLSFRKLTCLEMFSESNEETQELVRKRMKDDTLDIPEYLVEAQDTIGEDEARQYILNHHKQV